MDKILSYQQIEVCSGILIAVINKVIEGIIGDSNSLIKTSYKQLEETHV
jgi:hypothetical protein